MNDSPFGPASRRRFLAVAGAACASGILARAATAATDEADAPRRVFSTDREDDCDPPMHNFKGNVAVPWLTKVLGG